MRCGHGATRGGRGSGVGERLSSVQGRYPLRLRLCRDAARDRIAEQGRLAGLQLPAGCGILGPNCLGIANYLSGARYHVCLTIRPPRAMRTPAVGIAKPIGGIFAIACTAMVLCGASVSQCVSLATRLTWMFADLVAVSRGRSTLSGNRLCIRRSCSSGAPAGGGRKSPGVPTSHCSSTSGHGANGRRGGGLAHGVRLPARTPHTSRLRAGGMVLVEDSRRSWRRLRFSRRPPAPQAKVSPCSQLRRSGHHGG